MGESSHRKFTHQNDLRESEGLRAEEEEVAEGGPGVTVQGAPSHLPISMGTKEGSRHMSSIITAAALTTHLPANAASWLVALRALRGLFFLFLAHPQFEEPTISRSLQRIHSSSTFSAIPFNHLLQSSNVNFLRWGSGAC